MRESYLGDKAEPRECGKSQAGDTPKDSSDPCGGRYQNTGEPGYKPYTPHVTKAYIRYAFDYCIIEAGRRGRNWGLGLFMDSGDRPFATDASIYDGVTCNVNIQKTQTLGFSFGYDKLAETGAIIDPTTSQNGTSDEGLPGTRKRRFGANDAGDDIDQYFFTIEYDDRKANAGAAFTKQIGVYFAQINSRNYTVDEEARKETGGSQTDLKFLDLYTGFYFGDLAFKNELLFRMGKSKDPNWESLGGARYDADGDLATNKLDSIGFAGGLEWTMAHSGAPLGPAEFNKGDAKRHVLFFDYAYAPGDDQGYKSLDPKTVPTDAELEAAGITDPDQRRSISEGMDDMKIDSRDHRVKAIAFHRNFKPALLLFNMRPEADDLIVDGAFNPSRMVNATLVALGYRYENMEAGNFEIKLITATLNQDAPKAVKDYYGVIKDTKYDDGTRPAGFYGSSLGYELDLAYTYKVGREADLGLAGAFALPGQAWRTRVDSKPAYDFLLQSTATFHF